MESNLQCCGLFFKCFLSPYFCQDGIKYDSVRKSLQASLTSRKLDLEMIFECELGSLLFFAKGGPSVPIGPLMVILEEK